MTLLFLAFASCFTLLSGGCENPLAGIIERDIHFPPQSEISLSCSGTECVSGEEFYLGGCRIDETRVFTFNITNIGTARLDISSTAVTGSAFVINKQPGETKLEPEESTDFTLLFSPDSIQTYTGTITVINSDEDEGTFTMPVTAEGTLAEMLITLDDGTTELLSGTGEYDFGSIDAGDDGNATFIIHNTGSSDLRLTGTPAVDITGTGAAFFSADAPASTTVEAGSTLQLHVSFSPQNGTEQSAVIEIETNDPDNDPYTFTVRGTGIVPPAPAVTGDTVTLDTKPVWNWSSGGGTGTGTYRYKLDDSDLSSGASVTTDEEYTPGTDLTVTTHTLYVEESNSFGVFGSTGSFTVEIVEVMAQGWIGGGSDGWQTGDNPSSGSGYRSFIYPRGVSVDGDGNIYVADTQNHRVCKWDSDGNAVGWIGGGGNGWNQTTAPSAGDDYQSFDMPQGIAVDGDGYLYVADSSNHRISQWTTDTGIAQGWIGGGSNGWKQTTAPSGGNSDYQSFEVPREVYVDGDGNIYIADQSNYRICKWDSDGNAVGWIGGGSNGWKQTAAPSSEGTDYQSFYYTFNVALDTSGNIYVADYYNHRICKWTGSGNAVGWIGGGGNGWNQTTAPDDGSSDYQSFDNPSGAFIDASGDIYVADYLNNRVCKWDSSGNAVGWIGSGYDGWQTGSTASNGNDYKSFYFPYGGIHVDSSGNIFVADTYNHRISTWGQN